MDNYNMATTSEDSLLLNQAAKKMIYLKDEIQKLTDELRHKEALLSDFMDVAAGQSKRLASFAATLQDMVHCDPCRPQSCFTPQSPWSVVRIRGHP